MAVIKAEVDKQRTEIQEIQDGAGVCAARACPAGPDGYASDGDAVNGYV